MHTSAIATGTIGHNMLVIMDSVLLLLPLMTRNLIGLKPLRPLSPSGCTPLVTSWPLWLYCGRDARRPPRRSECDATVRVVFSVVYSREELVWSRDERPLAYSREALGWSREDREWCTMTAV
jgi:hypothetical protein